MANPRPALLGLPFLTWRGGFVLAFVALLWYVFSNFGVIIAAQLAVTLALFVVLTWLLCQFAWRPLHLSRTVWVRAYDNALPGPSQAAGPARVEQVEGGVPETLQGDPVRTRLVTVGRCLRAAVLETESGALGEPSARLGRYEFATPRCRVTDPFGLWRRSVTPRLLGVREVLVLPRLVSLPVLSRLAQHDAETELSPIPREYAVGDELRRVHWGASARRGKLMVRDVEPVERLHATVVITPALEAMGGAESPHVSAIVETGLSVAVNLAQHGMVVRICDGQNNALAPSLAAAASGQPGRARLNAQAIHVAQRNLALARLDDPHRADRTHELIEHHDEYDTYSRPSLVFTVGSGEVSTRGGNPAHPRPMAVPWHPEGPRHAQFTQAWESVLETL
ncbi:DUF58 domain-containing protein [Micrococcales bacterium 31B]|nr:DUF58 domain-containing protein [Micrococcales bacterium 31B]